MDERERAAMEAHYARMPRTGYAGRCEMRLPADLAGKQVLDLLCRTGKGAFKIVDRVGAGGFVLGIDPDAGRIERARASAPGNFPPDSDELRALAFERGFPEDLRRAGAQDASFDVVVANAALNLVWSLDVALREIARVLKPGGVLYHAGVFAAVETDPADARRFAAQGNVFGAARSRCGFERRALDAGFASCVHGEVEQAAPEGSEAVPCLAGASFEAAVLQAVK